MSLCSTKIRVQDPRLTLNAAIAFTCDSGPGLSSSLVAFPWGFAPAFACWPQRLKPSIEAVLDGASKDAPFQNSLMGWFRKLETENW